MVANLVLVSFVVLTILQCAGSVLSADTHLIFACGTTEKGKDADGREWDVDTKYLDPSTQSSTSMSSFQDPTLPSDVPFMNARLFTSEAKYKIPIKPGSRYWLRLYFYPSVYGSLTAEDSYFDANIGELTLLKNFSASLTCRAFSLSYVMTEYVLTRQDSDSITLTLKPSRNGSFVFINGIELVESPELFETGQMVGETDMLDLTTMTLQTVSRLNVGGNYIGPVNDTTLFRSWYDDTPYVYGSSEGVQNEADKNMTISLGSLTNYTAPIDLYGSSRSMGSDSELNKKYNITWQFQVEANFTYLLRLHFDDFFYDRPNQRVFDIYINNQIAQSALDVIGFSSETGVAITKDFMIYVGDVTGDDHIFLAIHPTLDAPDPPESYDAFLNGLEIFKTSAASGSLAGPNPEPSKMLLAAEAAAEARANQENKTFSSKTTKFGVIGGAAGVGAMAAICMVAYYRKKREPTRMDSRSRSWFPIGAGYSHTSGGSKSNSASHLSSEAQNMSRRFSIYEIKQATKNFDESNVIGVGGFGKVYKGVIDSTLKVAIKRSNPSSEQGVHEFQTEVEMLSKLRHKHLVSLIGFCEEENEMCLVYDFMALGTLREHIYKDNKPLAELSWKQRLDICIGAARGLHYLHTGARYTIIHRDVKTTNILLDENWVAKVSDFGLSKTGPNMDKGHVSTVVKGSFGYLDPEYFRRQQLTEKSDVYSFGVVLFEVLCARPVLNPNLPKEQVSLGDWARNCHKRGVLGDLIDPTIKDTIHPECLKKFADTAMKCLSDAGFERPHMGDVLWNLEFALQLQEGADGSSQQSRAERTSDFDEINLENDNNIRLHMNSLGLSEHELALDMDDSNQREIFSQIGNPKGR